MSSSEASNEEVESVLVDTLIPEKSKDKYLNVYDSFIKWKDQNNEKSFSEKVFLNYFNDISKKVKPSTLWAAYSMLKSTMRAKHNIYLQEYVNLLLWLKKRSAGYKSSQSKILTEANIRKFLEDAPDAKYLATKVALILGVCGQLRSYELTWFKTNNVKIVDGLMIGVLCDEQDKTERIFIIRDEFIPWVQKYQALRPKDVETDRLFLNLRDGRCTKQVIGRHKICTLPKEIATFLKLPHPERFTGHCFRRSAIGAVISNVDKGNKGHLVNATQGEVSEVLEFARRYRRGYSAKKNAIVEVEAASSECNVEVENMELANKVKIKTETRDENTTDEVYVKAEPFDEIFEDPINADMIDWAVSKPSTSGRFSQLSDVIMEDSDDSLDMVRILSEDVDRSTTLQALRDESSQGTSSEKDTKITVAGKNITIIFKNCTNVGNVTVNVINK
ncbi:uncharacterized protein LOC125234755 [Leguminivora glycinivorella]|uniref:uncharacterized protein LOC125234755 n=1 Tax=Leguminivora glycinivorella TaxID=1035111 RepID=UPI00200DBD04|nr:uncharacterized protein LOC125234755 [Leguminivora glycinivorella]